MGIPIPKTPVIWASPVTLTLILTQKEGDTYITRVLGMGMPKTRGCPYHCNTTRQKLLYNKGNGYKLSAQRFLGLFSWTSVSYDWSMIKATVNQL